MSDALRAAAQEVLGGIETADGCRWCDQEVSRGSQRMYRSKHTRSCLAGALRAALHKLAPISTNLAATADSPEARANAADYDRMAATRHYDDFLASLQEWPPGYFAEHKWWSAWQAAVANERAALAGPALREDPPTRSQMERAEDNVLERIAAHFGVDTSGMDFGHVEPGLWVEEFLKRRALREDPAPHDWNAALELAAHIVRSSGSSRALAGEGRVTHYHAQRISEEILSRRAARVSAPPRNLLDEYEEAAQDERGEVRE